MAEYRYRSDAEIVYCDEVSKGQIVESGLNRSVENDTFITEPDVSLTNHMYHAAKTVCAALLSRERNMPWSPYSTTILTKRTSVFPLLFTTYLLRSFLRMAKEKMRR